MEGRGGERKRGEGEESRGGEGGKGEGMIEGMGGTEGKEETMSIAYQQDANGG